jgi:hypothetical protein
MDRVALEHTETNATITRREVDMYAGNTWHGASYAILDDVHQRYTAIFVSDQPAASGGVAQVIVMAHVVGEYVVIDEDRTLDKPLYQALMVNGGIARDKIILAYQGEILPT